MNYQGKKILVIGQARSGMAAIRLLRKLGADTITLTERKEVKNREELESYGVRIVPQEDALFEEDWDLVIKNPGVPPVSPFIQKMKARGIDIITEVELAFRNAKPQHYAAITGTNGKTTTTTLTYEILKTAYKDKAHVSGNIGTPLCETVLDHNLLEEEGHYISLEISNAQLVDIDTFRPEVSVIVNMTPDHVDTMGGLDKYYFSKTRVYENAQAGDLFLKNTDDPVVAEYTEKYPVHCDVKTFSLEHDADICLKDGWIVKNGIPFIDTAKVSLPGKHNLQNIMIAAMCAEKLGVSDEDIKSTVYAFQGVEHRIEFVRELDGVRYYNDSKATNPDAVITALKSFDKGVILLVGGFEKGLAMESLLPYMGCVKMVIGLGVSGKRLATDLVGDAAVVVKDMKEAVDAARKAAVEGDIVLLSPATSSFDQYSGFEERGRHFKQLVNAL